MNWADYLCWALVLVCVAYLLVGLLGNLACSCLFGAADEVPQPTRRCDMRLVASQTRELDKAAPTRAQIEAARQTRETIVRTHAVNAALLDAGTGQKSPRACPYRPGSKAASLWQITYDRVSDDCRQADKEAKA